VREARKRLGDLWANTIGVRKSKDAIIDHSDKDKERYVDLVNRYYPTYFAAGIRIEKIPPDKLAKPVESAKGQPLIGMHA